MTALEQLLPWVAAWLSCVAASAAAAVFVLTRSFLSLFFVVVGVCLSVVNFALAIGAGE